MVLAMSIGAENVLGGNSRPPSMLRIQRCQSAPITKDHQLQILGLFTSLWVLAKQGRKSGGK